MVAENNISSADRERAVNPFSDKASDSCVCLPQSFINRQEKKATGGQYGVRRKRK